jgi:hypothetical protein
MAWGVISTSEFFRLTDVAFFVISLQPFDYWTCHERIDKKYNTELVVAPQYAGGVCPLLTR